jgi:hypothetical protein
MFPLGLLAGRIDIDQRAFAPCADAVPSEVENELATGAHAKVLAGNKVKSSKRLASFDPSLPSEEDKHLELAAAAIVRLSARCRSVH